MKKTMSLGVIICFLLMGCGSKNSDEIAELQEQVAFLQEQVNFMQEQLGMENVSNKKDGNNSKEDSNDVVKNNIGDVYYTDKLSEKSRKCNVAMNTKNGAVYFYVPDYATNIIMENGKLSYAISNKWMHINFLYEIDESINSAPECEIAAKELITDLPVTYEANNYNFFTDVYLSFFDSSDRYIEPTVAGKDISGIICTDSDTTGYRFFYVGTHKDSANALVYYDIMAESFTFVDGSAIHGKVDIARFDYQQYYDSLATSVEQAIVSQEYSNIRTYLSEQSHVYYLANGSCDTRLFYVIDTDCLTQCLQKKTVFVIK